MIHVTPGIVLARRRYKEFDRLAMVFTRDFGRLRVRYIGVDRPRAKLRAFTEPIVKADYRLYLRSGAEVATGIGGQIAAVYPGIRADLMRTHEAYYCCELMLRLTPEHAPNSEEFDLLSSVLDALESSPRPVHGEGSGEGLSRKWICLAFALRLLRLTGFGLWDIKPPEVPAGLWERLHSDSWGELTALPWDPAHFRAGFAHVILHIRDRIGQRIESERFLFPDPDSQPLTPTN